MNVFIFEMKSQFKSFVIWTVSMVLSMILFMQGMYPVFQESIEDIKDILAGYPKGLMQILGFDMDRIFSYGGFYSFIYSYIGLIGAIMAIIIALSVFAREKRFKCMDFILSKPISRKKIFCLKTLVCISILTLTNIIYIIASIWIYYINNQKSDELNRFILASLGLYFTQLVFLAMGILVATFFKKIRSVSGIATSFGFAAFILSALTNIIKEDFLYYIAPLKYFDPVSIISKGHFELKYIVAALLITLGCTLISFVKYCKSDVHAV